MSDVVSIPELWQPVLLSTVLVWIASALIWMVLPHHKKDFKALPDEEAARQALQGPSLTPGLYNIPHMESWDAAKDPAEAKKFTDGPVAFLTVLPNQPPPMGKAMVLSVLYYLVVSGIVAYLAGRTLAVGAEYLTVFRVAGTVAWLAYGFGSIPQSIWFGRPWSQQVKQLIDALVYALLTAGCFGWLWPRG